jgi:hypothetical protein
MRKNKIPVQNVEFIGVCIQHHARNIRAVGIFIPEGAINLTISKQIQNIVVLLKTNLPVRRFFVSHFKTAAVFKHIYLIIY